jgi:hypothetical protein
MNAQVSRKTRSTGSRLDARRGNADLHAALATPAFVGLQFVLRTVNGVRFPPH